MAPQQKRRIATMDEHYAFTSKQRPRGRGPTATAAMTVCSASSSAAPPPKRMKATSFYWDSREGNDEEHIMQMQDLDLCRCSAFSDAEEEDDERDDCESDNDWPVISAAVTWREHDQDSATATVSHEVEDTLSSLTFHTKPFQRWLTAINEVEVGSTLDDDTYVDDDETDDDDDDDDETVLVVSDYSDSEENDCCLESHFSTMMCLHAQTPPRRPCGKAAPVAGAPTHAHALEYDLYSVFRSPEEREAREILLSQASMPATPPPQCVIRLSPRPRRAEGTREN